MAAAPRGRTFGWRRSWCAGSQHVCEGVTRSISRKNDAVEGIFQHVHWLEGISVVFGASVLGINLGYPISKRFANSKGLDTQWCLIPGFVYPIWKSTLSGINDPKVVTNQITLAFFPTAYIYTFAWLWMSVMYLLGLVGNLSRKPWPGWKNKTPRKLE